MTNEILNASHSGTFLLGGDLPVYCLGFGTMRVRRYAAWVPLNDPT